MILLDKYYALEKVENQYYLGCIDEQTKNEIIKFIKHLPSVQPEQRWIPCSERLPELNSRCVLLYGNDNISGGYYRGNRTFDVDYGDKDVKTMVIAWMDAIARTV